MTAEKRPPVPAANDEQTALANLKSLLLGDEQASIERLQLENADPERNAERVADSLADSLHRAYAEAPENLTRALESPVSACIEDSVQRNPGFFADILFPVMGPAIRRSISQALKGLVQQINQTLEHSLTLKGLKWRMEAARTGVPFAEVVLRHTLRYRVEEAFLIQGGSGLLIQHLGHGPAPAKDADAVSAMLTAIRDFTRDTMHEQGGDSRLDTVDVGDHTLWLVHGPRAYLACAIRGVPPVSLRDDLTAIVEEIHQRHARLLDGFDGDQASASPIVPLLERCLVSEVDESRRKRFPWPLLLVALLILGLLGWGAYGLWQSNTVKNERGALLDNAAQQLRDAPGIVVTESRTHDDRLVLSGLHDPLMPEPATLLQQAGLTEQDYTLRFRRFESSEADAALTRARLRLNAPEGVTLQLDANRTLRASGSASPAWIERAALLATTVPGIDAFDPSGVQVKDRPAEPQQNDRLLEQQLRAAIQPPDQVSIRVQDGRARVAGEAPLVWIQTLNAAQPELPGLLSIDTDALMPFEISRLRQLVEMINAASVPFTEGMAIGETQRSRIETIAALIAEAFQHASDLGKGMRVEIIGRTDGTGTLEQNHFVASQRAEGVARVLQQSSEPMPPFELRAVTQPPNLREVDAELRRVEFRITGID